MNYEMEKETRYTRLPERSGRCTMTMKTWCSCFRSIVTKVSKQSGGSRTVIVSDSKPASLNGLRTSKKEAKVEAIRRMNDLGGRWGVVQIGELYCEVEHSYFKVHNVKPVWVRKTFIEWLTRKRL